MASAAALGSLLGGYASEDDVHELSEDEKEAPSIPAPTSTRSSLNTPGKLAFRSMFKQPPGGKGAHKRAARHKVERVPKKARATVGTTSIIAYGKNIIICCHFP